MGIICLFSESEDLGSKICSARFLIHCALNISEVASSGTGMPAVVLPTLRGDGEGVIGPQGFL